MHLETIWTPSITIEKISVNEGRIKNNRDLTSLNTIVLRRNLNIYKNNGYSFKN